jgi:glycosyltransferase involved in cell wall biosynthesis
MTPDLQTAARERAPGAVALPAPDLAGARVGVVIPAYRVAAQIERVVRGIPAWVASIIVVEDHSPDDTAERVERLRDPRVTLLRHAANRGVGGAMKTGLAEARRQGLDVVVKMDGDDQMDPAHLPALVQPLVDGRADVTKANRYSSLGSLQGMPVVRVLGNAGLTFLVKAASGYWNVFDPANGYVALRGELLARLDLERLPERYYFESGFLVELGIQRAVVLDVAVPARYADEHSSLSPSRVLLEFPPRLCLGLARRVFWRYYVHDFTAVSVELLLGVPLLLFGAVFGAWQWIHLRQAGQFASAGIVMLAAMPILLGFQLVLQAVALDVQNVPRAPLCAPIRRTGGAATGGA